MEAEKIFFSIHNYPFCSLYRNSVQFSQSVVYDCLRLHGLQLARPPCPSPTLEFAQTHVHKSMMPSNYLILRHPLLLLPSIFPSIRVFSKESVLRLWWPKCWSFSFRINPSNEYLGLSSSRIDLFDLLAVQRTLKSLLQHHSSKASVIGPQPSLWSNSQIDTWLLEKL